MYAIGIKKRSETTPMLWPEPESYRPMINDFLNPYDEKYDNPVRRPTSFGYTKNVDDLYQILADKGHDPYNEDWIISIKDRPDFRLYKKKCSPCITR